MLAAAIVLFHAGAAKSIVNLLLKNKRFKNRGTNAFTLRQLSGKLGSNSALAGALAFLIAFAVIGSNVSFVQKISNDATLDKNYPFDISATLERGEAHPFPFDEAERIIEKYTAIEEKLYYSTYTSENNYLHSFTKWSGEGYGGLYDTFMTESDFNKIYGALGFAPIDLKGGIQNRRRRRARGKLRLFGRRSGSGWKSVFLSGNGEGISAVEIFLLLCRRSR